jgi:hypothetical protein
VTQPTLPSRAPTRAAHLLLLAVAAGLVVATASCGASIQAVYEGDVRFEHCMALDSRADVKPAIPAACWEEWLKFYTFGQTRDRLDYARLRDKQLSVASEFTESSAAPRKSGPSAVPDPTSVLAPPPMLLTTDGGAPYGSALEAGVADAAAEASAPPGAECAAECEQTWSSCKKECKAAPCEKACTTKYKRCMKRCF